MSSVLSGKTLGSGMAFHGQMGWPGVSATLLGSAGSKLDLGGKFSFNYGYEGITDISTSPGTKLQGVLRLNLLERGKFNLGLRFSPGFFFYFRNLTVVGMTLPVDLVGGFQLTPQLMLNFGVDLPMFAVFGEYGGFIVPFLVGGGLEYAIDRTLGLTFNLRAGPSAPAGVGPYWNYGWYYDRWGRVIRDSLYGWPAVEAQFGLTVKL
ncbi:MAG: hypothetical protein WBV82_03960 [Myxococcaceae bacterium]